MTPGQLSRLSSPISARQRVEKVLSVRNGEDKPVPKRKSAVETLQEELSLRDARISELEGKLRDAEFEGAPPPTRHDDGDIVAGLRHLLNDSAQEIATAIMSMTDASKAGNIARAIIGEAPASKPSKPKGKGYTLFVNAWKAIREDLRAAADLTPEQRKDFFDLIENDIGEAKAEAPEAPAPKTPATETKPMTMPDRKRAAAERARALGDLDLAERIEKARYVRDIENAIEELDHRETLGN
jgi:hypothetical protein